MKRPRPAGTVGLRWVALAALVALLGATAWGARNASLPHATPRAAKSALASSASLRPAEAPARVTAGAPVATRSARRASSAARRPAAGATAANHLAGGATVAPGSAGMIIAVDPETGELRVPTSEEARALADVNDPAVSRSDEGLVEIRKPDGSVGINLQGRFQDYFLARIGPDGKPLFRCVQGAAEAGRALRDTLPQPRLEEK